MNKNTTTTTTTTTPTTIDTSGKTIEYNDDTNETDLKKDTDGFTTVTKHGNKKAKDSSLLKSPKTAPGVIKRVSINTDPGESKPNKNWLPIRISWKDTEIDRTSSISNISITTRIILMITSPCSIIL